MKIVRHEKNRGKYFGFKSGVTGEYECTLKLRERPPVCHAGSTGSGYCLCPFTYLGTSTDNLISPSALSPEFINELLKSDAFKEAAAGTEADTTVILFGNALVINRNTACNITSGENIFSH